MFVGFQFILNLLNCLNAWLAFFWLSWCRLDTLFTVLVYIIKLFHKFFQSKLELQDCLISIMIFCFNLYFCLYIILCQGSFCQINVALLILRKHRNNCSFWYSETKFFQVKNCRFDISNNYAYSWISLYLILAILCV